MSELIYLPGVNKDKDSKITDICNYVVDHSGNCYMDILNKDFRPSVFEALTDRSAAEFAWYNFECESKVLELRAGWGGSTGVLSLKCRSVVSVEENLYKAQALCKRYEDRNNLAVYAGDWHCIKENGVFDYAIFHDVEEYLAEHNNEKLSALIEKLYIFLKPTGSLLLNIANRYAMKYWCGEPLNLSQTEFPHLAEGGVMYGFSKKEIESELSEIEGMNYKFYYPMYDRHKPQQIFTDDNLPKSASLKEMELYRRNKNAMLNDERQMYACCIEAGIFNWFAEAFMVECAREKHCLSNITYAKLSADRPRRLAMATVLMKDKVAKIALFEEGYEHLQDMLNYQKDLQNHGIRVLPMEKVGNMLVMPFLKHQRLGYHLCYLAKTDKIAFVTCLDRLYNLICRSSEHALEEDSSLCAESKDAEWGPVLKHAYLELIDLNCFYDGDFLFFDQEFMRESMPAKYIMYRELLNLYHAHPDIENYVKKNDMYSRFGIDKVYQAVEKEEFNNFIPRLFDKDLFTRLRMPYESELWRQKEARRETYLFAGCANKILVVIGCGTRFKRYMSQYGKRYSPDILVDNNSNRWGEEICGVVVSPPKRLSELDAGQLHVIICIKDYDDIEAQLLEMKIYNYRIF